MFREEELNLFIADDDAAARGDLGRELTSIVHRAHVTEADSAATAIEVLCARPFDCAFLDNDLIDGDALKVMRAVRSAGVDTPIVILTSQGDEMLAVEVMKAGASDYIPKARISRERLSQSLTGAIRLHRAERAKEQTERLRQQAEDRVKFLSDASIILGSSLDYEATLGNIARLSVPRFADLCIVDIYEDGVIRRTGIAHADPALAAYAAGLKQYPPDPAGQHPVAMAIRTGLSQFSHDAPDGLIRTLARNEDHLDLLQILHFQSYIVTPLIARGRTLGAISFVKTADGTQYNDTDVLVAEELSRRAAVAVDNARLFAAGVQEREELEASEARYRFLSDSIPQIVWTATPDGTCNYLNDRWYEFTGLTPEQSLAGKWVDPIHPDERERCERLWRIAVSTGEPFQAECRLRDGRDGSYRWHLIRALPQRDADQRTLLWFGTSTDIDDQKRTEQLQRYLAEASTILASSLDYEATLPRIASLSVPQIADWCAIDLLEGDTIRRAAVAHVDPAKIDLAVEFHRRYPPSINEPAGVPLVLRTGQPVVVREITDEMIEAGTPDPEQRSILQSLGLRSFICAPIRARGRSLGAITFIAAESGRLYNEADLALANELAYRIGLAVDNAQLFIETQERAKREELINAIAKKLRASLDAGEIMRSALTEVGRAFGASRASWLRLNKERGVFEITPQQWCAPGVAPFLRNYEVTSFPDAILAAYRRGETVAVNNLATDPRTADLFQDLERPPGAISVLGCPVFVRGELNGILTVTAIDHEREWTDAETDTLSAICSTLALALENARIYAREHRVADMLQSAFLANIPSRLPGLSVRSSYRAGLEESQVGGDFYDAFTLPDGRVAMVMADVSGKGLSAAVQTATVKYSLRAFAAEAAAPSLVLTRLNRMLRADSSGLGDHFVTLFYAVFDPGSGRLAFASAGHETQVVKRRTGGTTLMTATGPILGITEHRYEQAIDYLGPGDSVILFTDGLTEARSKARELLEINRVVAAIDRIPGEASAGAIVSRLERLAMNWAENRPHDDLALLVVRNDGDGVDVGFEEHELLAGSVPLQPGNDLELLFDFAFQSLPDYAAEVRQALGHWMGALGFDREAIEDFQTAVTEAVTNAIRHGSPQGSEDQFLVRGYRSLDDDFIVEVGDRGPGLRTPVLEPQMPSPEATGGRGLPLMQVLADDVAYLPSAIAHWVRLVKRPANGHRNGNGAGPGGNRWV